MSLDRAIAQLEAEVAAFNQGTLQQPAENSTEWFVLRAKSLGLSALRRMAQLQLHGEPASAERYYREAGKRCKTADVPPAPIIEKEKPPAGFVMPGA